MKSNGEVKLFIGILVVAVALVGVAVWPMLASRPNVEGPKDSKLTKEKLVPAWSHVRGDDKATAYVVEIGDYQCGFCGESVPKVKHTIDAYKEKIKFVFHACQVMPSHTNALILSAATEAAADQGKYWEMHEAIYKAQKEFSDKPAKEAVDRLTKLAGDLKMDMLRFRSALNKEEFYKKASREEELVGSLRVTLTPTFFFISPSGKVSEIATPDLLESFLKKPPNWK